MLTPRMPKLLKVYWFSNIFKAYLCYIILLLEQVIIDVLKRNIRLDPREGISFFKGQAMMTVKIGHIYAER